LGDNAREEEAPREDEPFDFNAKPSKFYFDVETDGSLGAQEVVMKGIAELQKKLAALIWALRRARSGENEMDMPARGDPAPVATAAAGAWGAGAGGSGGWGEASSSTGGAGGGGGWGGGASPSRGATNTGAWGSATEKHLVKFTS